MKLFTFAGLRMGSLAGALLLLTGAYSGYAQTSTSNFNVTITSPADDASFTAPTNIQIDAVTFDTNDDVASVTFIASPPWGLGPSRILGTVTNPAPTVPPGSHRELFILTWTNVPIGTWVLTASAVRTNGTITQETHSPPVDIHVLPNGPLYVDIAWPTNGATFIAPATIQVIAGLINSNGPGAAVQFFDGTNSLGIATGGAVVDPPGSPGLPPGSLAYFLTWSNPAVGIHVLTAVATNTNGQSYVSTPVSISVISNPPPSFTVTITAPTNNASFTAPTNILIDALTFDTNDDVAEVTFTASEHGDDIMPMDVIDLGTVSNGVPVGPPGSHQEQFSITWSNVPDGKWVLIAAAFRSNGTPFPDGVFSPPVTITVVRPPPAISVDIASPGDGATFVAPANIQLVAGVVDTNGGGARVQFFDGATSLGIVSNGVVVGPPGSPGLPPGSLAFSLTWSNASIGGHDLTAVATDTNGNSAVSSDVFIAVISNFPPEVRITSPHNNAVFVSPVNIPLLAYANDSGGAVSNVQFFAGSNSLGFGTPVLFPPMGPEWTNSPWWPNFPTNIFELIWTNPPPDAYVLTALATFSNGDSATSAPVDITVVTPSPPPTNRPNVVNIVATDPIAIEGTNCWTWTGLPETNGPPTWSNWTSHDDSWCSFTNCGPKDATFTVRRHGETSNDLTVNYTIGGMASNGVDYVALPGTVDIPAGQKEAMITIVPIDADTNNTPDTVILTLSADTNSPPNYRVGFPQSAEALILNSEAPFPVLTGRMMHDHSFSLSMNGPDGGWFRIDYSGDCLNWTPVCTNQVVDGLINFADPTAGNAHARWYRAVPLANRPSN